MTVMIKSWTGEMVPLRMGMAVKVKDSSYNGGEVVNIDAENDVIRVMLTPYLHWNGGAKELTMISCPFAVGDEVLVFKEFSLDWARTTINQNDLESKVDIFRHANPNLRTKPEGNV
jgi:hypothetical protein